MKTHIGSTLLAAVLWILQGMLQAQAAQGALGPSALPAAVSVLMQEEQAPVGVVFEIAEADEQALDWALPLIRRSVKALRGRFPDLPVAVVTHGREQFALETQGREQHAQVHRQVQTLVQQQRIPVYICETHASWRDKSAEDFPDYVNVAVAGPTQVRDYVEIGYRLVRLRR